MKNKSILKEKHVNLLIIGATGVGKSSTINALFDDQLINQEEYAHVGHGVSPETKLIKKYTLNKVSIWDTPGFGDGNEDRRYYKEIVTLLNKRDEDNFALIDMAIVIIDSTSKDIGTTMNIINDILIPNLGKSPEKRILVALNKIDLIKSGKYWDLDLNKPLTQVITYMEDLKKNISSRIKEATSISISPIIYSAGDKKHNQHPYNLLVFINNILINLPDEKRLAIAKNTNSNKNNWYNNDNTEIEENTTRKILREVFRSTLLAGISSLFGGLFLFDI